MATEVSSPDTHTRNGFRGMPVQRQQWGEKQCVPHTNWGDMFFDLFYVAAAYNLADIIKADPSMISLLYFFGCFGPITSIWMNKMIYDGRFQTPDDIFHPILEVIQLCFLAGAVQHIRPVNYMSQGTKYTTMMIFCLFVWVGNLYNIFGYSEIRLWGVTGQQINAKHSAVTSIYSALIPFFFVTVATLYSLIVYINANTFSGEKGDGGEDYDKIVHHAPIILLLTAWIIRMGALFPIIYFRGKGKDHKEITVPVNVKYVIHRCGEWTMLMLGESVLSLLIVPVVKGEFQFYFTFFVGVLSVIFLQFLYFKSQPHHEDGHAFRRTRLAGAMFAAMLQFYSAGLILVGVSFKMLLNEFKIDEVNYEERSLLVAHDRLLAGEKSPLSYSREEMRERIANFFCLSLLAVFLFLDAMILCHKGIKASVNRCSCSDTGRLRASGVLVIVIFRLAIDVFIGTACLYITSPAILALFGLISIFLQVGIRYMGDVFFPSLHVEVTRDNEDPKQDDEDVNNERWPNVTQPAVVHDGKQ